MQCVLSGSIVLYNSKPQDINNLIRKFSAIPFSGTLYLIDNSLNDSLRLKLDIDGSAVSYQHNLRNTGYIAHNIAFKQSIDSGYSYHVVLNPDVDFEPSIFTSILKFMDAHPDVGQLMPKVLNTDGTLQYVCKLLPTPLDLFARFFLPKKMLQKRMDNFVLRQSGYNKIMDVPYLSGCFMFFRNKALQQVGLFDERFFMYGEDIDITRRMFTFSRSVFFPEVSIIHKHEAGSYKSLRLFKIHTYNVISYFNKYGWFFDSFRKTTNKQVLSKTTKFD